MRFYRDVGIVLGGHKLGEADRIVIILTRNHGLIRAVAKGIRRTKSRFGSRLEPFMFVDVQCHIGRSLDIITQVELLEPFARGIMSDYDTYAAATGMAETAIRLTEDEPQARAQFLLLLAAIRSLCNGEHAPGLSRDAYLLRAMSLAGWAPSLDDCAQCGAPGPHRAFSPALGGAVCHSCRPHGTALPSSETMDHLTALMSRDWQRVEASSAYHQAEASRLIVSYVQWHLERKVKSLAVLASQPAPIQPAPVQPAPHPPASSASVETT
ncbi:DNA repair protein RecO [Brevibacterium otitidis]|uniref:DNA repair protein RecO n=1 Tax=Brevibacterium otitidis TaxID=53364 RepID=A0ABV5X389_9MICO|nr:DNA repair protein RecO [Brevibacterium otitidis]